MVTQQNPVRSYILKNISDHPDNIIKDTAVHFDISVQAVYKHIKFLLTNRGKLLNDQMPLAQLKLIASEPYFRDLYELEMAIQLVGAQPAVARKAGGGREDINALLRLRRRIKALGDIELRPKPLLNGHDLIRLGAMAGPGLGQLAEEMYIAQLEGKLQNTEQAKQWVQKWLQKHKAGKAFG